MIKTKLVYDDQTLIDFFTFHLKRKDKIRWIYYSISIAFFLIGMILSIVFQEYFLSFIIAVCTTIMFMIFPSQAKRAAKKTADSRYKREPQDIIFYDNKIEQHLERQILVYNWSLVKDVHETKKYIYFYISDKGALIVNKSCITNSEYEQLVQLVKSKQIEFYIYK